MEISARVFIGFWKTFFRLVFSRVFHIHGNLRNVKEKHFTLKMFIFPPIHWLKKSDYSSLNIFRSWAIIFSQSPKVVIWTNYAFPLRSLWLIGMLLKTYKLTFHSTRLQRNLLFSYQVWRQTFDTKQMKLLQLMLVFLIIK